MNVDLEAAREEGLEAFDGPRFRFVATLLQRAEDAPEQARKRLLHRAGERLAAIREDFERSRAEAERELERLEHLGVDASGLLRAAFERHDHRAIRRAARRHPETEPREGRRLGASHARRLRDRLAARAPFVGPTTGEARPDDLLEIAQALYRERTADAVAQTTLADARRHLPPDAGPYHALTVAARALGALESSSRPLLRAWIQHLQALDA